MSAEDKLREANRRLQAAADARITELEQEVRDLEDKLRRATVESYRRGQARIGRCRDCRRKAVKGKKSCSVHLEKARKRKAAHFKRTHSA